MAPFRQLPPELRVITVQLNFHAGRGRLLTAGTEPQPDEQRRPYLRLAPAAGRHDQAVAGPADGDVELTVQFLQLKFRAGSGKRSEGLAALQGDGTVLAADQQPVAGRGPAAADVEYRCQRPFESLDRKSTRLNSSHVAISYA